MKSLFPRAIISMLIVAMFVPIFGSAPCESAQRAQAGSSESGPPFVQAATPGAQASQSQPAMVWKPEETQALLQKIYMAAFRINDLLTLLRPDQWKMGDAERKSFSQTLDSLRDQLKTLEQWRYQLMAQPQNTSVADKTSAALDAVRTSVEAFARAVGQYDSPGAGAEYKGAAETLSGLAQ